MIKLQNILSKLSTFYSRLFTWKSTRILLNWHN